MLIAIPQWCKYLAIELDGTIWGQSYRNTEERKGKTMLLGRINTNTPFGVEEILPMTGNTRRFINEKLELVTIDGRPYHEYTFEFNVLNK